MPKWTRCRQLVGKERCKLKQEEAWDKIDKDRQALQQRLVEVRIIKTFDKGTLQLNAGGLSISVCKSVLGWQGAPDLHTLASLLEREWDKRLPRDGDGFIFLDESPTCVEHIIDMALVNALGTASGE